MIEKSCLDCGHRKVCERFRVFRDMAMLLLNDHSELSDEKVKEAISSVATCFGTLCVDWLSKSKL
ncbi:hypothetical protein LCGC14_0664320 [marine sediment metagenome]|uniref:Uncharacterized protein n=1 Tax=marine sediment metagenome TaxID=412755 RepID=A0A0F9TE64_9ZZZZ